MSKAIVTVEERTEVRFKMGDYVICKSNGLLVLYGGEFGQSGKTFEGIVISSGNADFYKPGLIKGNWMKSEFVLFSGKITIEQ